MQGEKAQDDGAAGVSPILKRVVGNAGVLLGGRSLNAVLGLGYMAVAARALGAADLGALVLIHAFAQLVGDVTKFQSWQTVLHYGARPLAEGRVGGFQRVLRFTLCLDAASAVVALAVGVGGALLLGGRLGWGQTHTPAAAFYMLSIVAMVSATPMGLMRLFNSFPVLAKQTVLVSFLRLAGSGLAFLLHAPLEGFLLAWAAGTVGGFAYLTAVTLRELARRGLLAGFQWRGPLTEGMPGAWRFAWTTNLSGTLDVAFTHAVTLAIGGLVGPAEAAYWRVGRQVADAIAKPARLLVPALYPELARLRAGGGEALMWRLAGQVGLLAGGACVVLLAISAWAGPPLLTLVMGASFAPAAAVMTWQVAAVVIGVFALPLEPMLISLGRTGPTVGVQLAVGASYLAALPFLLRHFALAGAGAGLVAAEAGLALGLLWFLLRERRPSAAGS
ncbi:MAG: putative rane protein involved in the export of O-antigen and teichoic acid [Phenylobacterium sp.]|nr:putative rane protein involved in the export of O-antigen and teichoic acid [Phenylobacterium sp.]